jgi:hypothetical protein
MGSLHIFFALSFLKRGSRLLPSVRCLCTLILAASAIFVTAIIVKVRQVLLCELLEDGISRWNYLDNLQSYGAGAAVGAA